MVKRLLGLMMIGNAALFFFGAIQHIGVTIGRFHEPHIIPAAIVETICGISLASSALIVLTSTVLSWRTPLISNLIALGGVLLGMVALAAGRGPRTASNDLYHHIMLSLIAASLVLLAVSKSLVRH
jgi:prepilin signal peptidase PulO-like enzyme (type II secretory pathway)